MCACKTALFRLLAAHWEVAFQIFLNQEEVIYWDNGITHSSVHDGVPSLNVIEYLIILLFIEAYLSHVESPVSLRVNNCPPEDVICLGSWLSVFWEVITAKGYERSWLVWLRCQVKTEHGVKLVRFTESIYLFYLLNECLQLLLRTLWSQSDDSSKSVLVNSICLVTLKNFDATDAWLTVVWRKADCLLIEVAVNVSRSIAVLNSIWACIVRSFSRALLEKSGTSNLILILTITVFSALISENIDNSWPCIKLHIDFLQRISKIYLAGILLIVYIFQRDMSNICWGFFQNLLWLLH